MNGQLQVTNRRSAFSLIELSIVLVIIAILIAAMTFSIQTRIDAAKAYTTRERMNLIMSALDIYYQQFGVLPCGAPTVAKETTDYGYSRNSTYAAFAANANAVCNGLWGSDIPFKVLGLDATTIADGWGNRFVYWVAPKYSIIDFPDASPYYAAASLDIINDSTLDPDNPNIDIAYILTSYGANGYGAVDDISNTRRIIPSDASVIEASNDAKLANPNGVIFAPGWTYTTHTLELQFGQTRNDDIMRYKPIWALPAYISAP